MTTTTCLSVVLTILFSFNQPAPKAEKIGQVVCKENRRGKGSFELDPLVILSVMYVETRFRHFKKPTRTRDYGIMQIHCPSRNYAPYCKNRKRLLSLRGNIEIGIDLLRRIKKKYSRRSKKLSWIRYYNWGNPKYRDRILRTYQKFRRLLTQHQRGVIDGNRRT